MICCAALTPTRGRYESCPISAVLMLTTPGTSARAAVAMERMRIPRIRIAGDFRMGLVLLSVCWLVCWLTGDALIGCFPHLNFHLCLLFTPFLSSAPPPFADP